MGNREVEVGRRGGKRRMLVAHNHYSLMYMYSSNTKK